MCIRDSSCSVNDQKLAQTKCQYERIQQDFQLQMKKIRLSNVWEIHTNFQDNIQLNKFQIDEVLLLEKKILILRQNINQFWVELTSLFQSIKKTSKNQNIDNISQRQELDFLTFKQSIHTNVFQMNNELDIRLKKIASLCEMFSQQNQLIKKKKHTLAGNK
eukprot:TRINITY_DN3914_c0_g2_i1.p1 TRINITY_DN3914_c0_g2~~TRINITY_DN3914_c0_g2_i1.p1  ORF type:complete len:161 (-),score=26.74 TRINITY_DN3914_c0_g2_i1:438-920(-)